MSQPVVKARNHLDIEGPRYSENCENDVIMLKYQNIECWEFVRQRKIL
jgi:hypothetical protein